MSTKQIISALFIEKWQIYSKLGFLNVNFSGPVVAPGAHRRSRGEGGQEARALQN